MMQIANEASYRLQFIKRIIAVNATNDVVDIGCRFDQKVGRYKLLTNVWVPSGVIC